MNQIIACLLAGIAIVTAPGDFAVNRLFLLLLLFVLILLHHFVKGRPRYYRATEYGLISAVLVVWLAGFWTPHYYLLQPLINGTLTAHAMSAVVYFWPSETEKRERANKILYKAFPWFLVALLAQYKGGDWLSSVRQKEKYLPPIEVPATTAPGETTTIKVNLADSLRVK